MSPGAESAVFLRGLAKSGSLAQQKTKALIGKKRNSPERYIKLRNNCTLSLYPLKNHFRFKGLRRKVGV
jgi:hypothetical protein